MARPWMLVANKPWISLNQDFTLFLRTSAAKFLALKSVIPVIVVLYAMCIGVAYFTWMALLLCDLIAGKTYADGILHLTHESAHQFVLPSLQFTSGALGLLVGLSVLTDAYFTRIKGECLYWWNIRRLAKVKYGSLVEEEEKREECCICLEGIGGEEIVRILPNCKHYNLHGRCIDRWLLRQSSCPVCRAPVCR